MPVVEFLVQRGANVNHSNATGNTPLHFAMSYDTSGKMGEYLINNGADDTIENKQGLSPCELFTFLMCVYSMIRYPKFSVQAGSKRQTKVFTLEYFARLYY